jgi:hypothetical protein
MLKLSLIINFSGSEKYDETLIREELGTVYSEGGGGMGEIFCSDLTDLTGHISRDFDLSLRSSLSSRHVVVKVLLFK